MVFRLESEEKIGFALASHDDFFNCLPYVGVFKETSCRLKETCPLGRVRPTSHDNVARFLGQKGWWMGIAKGGP